jgi:hypothetical protein
MDSETSHTGELIRRLSRRQWMIALAVAAVVVYRKFFAGGDDSAGLAGKGAHASSTAARGRGTRASAFDLDYDEAGEGFLQGEAESMQVLRAAAPMRR